MKILFFGRHQDTYSHKLSKFLKKKGSTKIIWSDGKKNKINFKINGLFDYIICFRSNYILSKKVIDKAKIAAINFHPGTPEYRGIGCINLALLNNVKEYGSTVHLINEKIDSGYILDVTKFKVKIKDDLNSVLINTHQIMYKQSVRILKKIFLKPSIIRNLVLKNKNIKWGKQMMTRKKLDKLYEINFPVTEKLFQKKVRALKIKDFHLYFKLKNKKYFID